MKSSPSFIAIYLTSTLTVMAGATISPALPAMAQYFQAHPQVNLIVGLILTMPGIAVGVTALFAGIFIDRFGRKPTLWGLF
jgi:MFS family permease